MSEGREDYHGYSVDDEDQPGAEDSGQPDDVEDELDRGYSPPDRPSPDYGNTPWEEAHGETLEQRLEQEEPDPDPRAGDDDEEQDEAIPLIEMIRQAGFQDDEYALLQESLERSNKLIDIERTAFAAITPTRCSASTSASSRKSRPTASSAQKTSKARRRAPASSS